MYRIELFSNSLNKLIAQTYDGANVVTGDEVGGVQGKINTIFQFYSLLHTN